MPYSIIVIEDDKVHREELVEALEDAGHFALAFRDLKSFQERLKEDTPLFEKVNALIIILDVMLAHDLSEAAEEAPLWELPGFPPYSERGKYVDYELGLRIAQDIRAGKYEGGGEYRQGVPKDTPVLFLTGRRNGWLEEEMKKLFPSRYLAKPAFVDGVCDALVELMNSVEKSANDR